MRTYLFLVGIGLLLNLTSCTYRMAFGSCDYRTKTGECYQETVQDIDITSATYTAADNLMRNAVMLLRPQDTLLVTTIADLNNLEASTSLGRLIEEQLVARFAQKGYTIKETRLHDGLIIIPQTGEFILSYEVAKIPADLIIAGTYAVAKDTVYVTLKMLDCKNGNIVASYAYPLPLGPNTLTLLQPKRGWW